MKFIKPTLLSTYYIWLTVIYNDMDFEIPNFIVDGKVSRDAVRAYIVATEEMAQAIH
jgi:hypothetical protein